MAAQKSLDFRRESYGRSCVAAALTRLLRRLGELPMPADPDLWLTSLSLDGDALELPPSRLQPPRRLTREPAEQEADRD